MDRLMKVGIGTLAAVAVLGAGSIAVASADSRGDDGFEPIVKRPETSVPVEVVDDDDPDGGPETDPLTNLTDQTGDTGFSAPTVDTPPSPPTVDTPPSPPTGPTDDDD